MLKKHHNLPVIGSNALVTVCDISNIPAKIDTGADSSSIWASDIVVTPDGNLEFALLGPESPFYTGQRISLKKYSVQRVRNSTGDITIRYRVKLPAVIAGKRIRANFTLYDRSRNNFPILLGRKTLKNRFLVDVAQTETKAPPKLDNTDIIAELEQNPQKFHAKLYRLHEEFSSERHSSDVNHLDEPDSSTPTHPGKSNPPKIPQPSAKPKPKS